MANVKLTITNIDKGPRGVNAKGGTVLLDPGQTAELELAEAEAADLSKTWFKTAQSKVDDGSKGYEDMTRAALDALAAERKVDISEAKNKGDVIAALQLADETAKA